MALKPKAVFDLSSKKKYQKSDLFLDYSTVLKLKKAKVLKSVNLACLPYKINKNYYSNSSIRFFSFKYRVMLLMNNKPRPPHSSALTLFGDPRKFLKPQTNCQLSYSIGLR